MTTAAEVEGSVGGVVSISMASSRDEMSGSDGVRCSTSPERGMAAAIGGGGGGGDIVSKNEVSATAREFEI